MEFSNKNVNSSINFRRKSESNNSKKSFTCNKKRNKPLINLKCVIKSSKNIEEQSIKSFPQLQLNSVKSISYKNNGNLSDRIVTSNPKKYTKNIKSSPQISRNENLPKKKNLSKLFETLVNIRRKIITLNEIKLNVSPKTIYHSYTKNNKRYLSKTEKKTKNKEKIIITSYHKKNDVNFSENQKRAEAKIRRLTLRKKSEVIRTMDNHIKYINKIRDKEMILLINRYKKEMRENKRIGINHYYNSVYPVAMIQYLIKTKDDLTIDKYRNEYLNKIDRYKTTVISKLIKNNNNTENKFK